MDVLYKEGEVDGIHPALWYDDVGVALRRLDEVTMHRLDGREILLQYGAHISATLLDITYETTGQTHVIIRIDEDLHVHEFTKFLVLEDQDTIEDDHLGRMNEHSLRETIVVGEGIDGALNGLPLLELTDMLDHHIGVERVRMVVVELGTLF